jgi:hypothetical protein
MAKKKEDDVKGPEETEGDPEPLELNIYDDRVFIEIARDGNEKEVLNKVGELLSGMKDNK